MTRGTGAFFSGGADFDFALEAKARRKLRSIAEERESIEQCIPLPMSDGSRGFNISSPS